MSHPQPHVLLVAQQAHGHLNPTIQLATNLILAGARVTIATTASGFHKLKALPPLHGLSFASFSDGHDDDVRSVMTPGYFQEIKRVGSETLAGVIRSLSERGEKVTFLVYTLLLPWAAVVARELHIPSALLVVQSATSFKICDRFCNSHDGILSGNHEIKASISLKLPGIQPLFTWGDLPTFLLPASPYHHDLVSVFKEHLQFLEEDPNPRILINTFDELESESLKSIANAVAVGPLVRSFSGDGGSYFQWLDSKPEKSVVYVSFGSVLVLNKTQKEEVLHGLIESGRPFLLVLREDGEDDEEMKELKKKIGDDGLIVKWCAQPEVLRHGGIGCFVSHCGWNSTVESMVAGVAVVGCPLFADQMVNAKMVEEVWGNGVRAVVDETGLVRWEEIKRCLEVVMGGGETAVEIKKMVEKWKRVADESVKDGGSSNVNLKLLLESIS